MSSFTEDVEVRNRLSGRVHEWVLLRPMSYYIEEPDGPFIGVTDGFSTDFASVPRLFWWWIAPWGRHGRAAIVHDWLYQGGRIVDPRFPDEARRASRSEADRIFRQAMAVLDRVIFSQHRTWGRTKALTSFRSALAAPKRWVMWAAVAAFGGPAYRRCRRERGEHQSHEPEALYEPEF